MSQGYPIQQALEDFEELCFKLAKAIQVEADPANLPHQSIPPAERTADMQKDIYWSRKNAAAAYSLLNKTQWFLDHLRSQADRLPVGAQTPQRDVHKQLALKREIEELAALTADEYGYKVQ